jgi:DNA repair protein RAD16
VGHDMEQRSDALDKLHSITARIMLRRMKKDYTASMVSIVTNTVFRNTRLISA